MIRATSPGTVGWASVLGGSAGAVMPAPPVLAVVTVVLDGDAPVVFGGPPAAQAEVALRASSARPTGTARVNRVNRTALLFRRPAGLAVGLAPKEMRLSRIHREMSPGDIRWVP